MKKIIVLLILTCILPVYAEQVPQQASNNGRYVYIQHPQFRGEQYLLDTKTGKVWVMYQEPKEGFLYFKAIRFNNADGSIKYNPQ